MKKAAQNKFILLLAISVLVGIFLLTSIFQKPQNKSEDVDRSPISGYEYQDEKLIDDFPDMPLHPDTNVLSSSMRVDGDSIEYSATLHIPKISPEEVADWYDDRLKQEDYDFYDLYEGPEEMEGEDEGYTISVTKANIGYVFNIIVSADDGSEVIIEANKDMD